MTFTQYLERFRQNYVVIKHKTLLKNIIDGLEGFLGLNKKGEEIVYKLKIDEKTYYKNQYTKITKAFNDTLLEFMNKDKNDTSIKYDLQIDFMKAEDSIIDIDIEQTRQDQVISNILLKSTTLAYDRLCENIVNDIKTLFENSNTDIFKQKVNHNKKESMFSKFIDLFESKEKGLIKDIMNKDQNISQTVHNEFENFKSSLKNDQSKLNFLNELNQSKIFDSSLKFKVIELSKSKFTLKSLQSIRNSIVQRIQIDLLHKIISNISESSSFEIETFNKNEIKSNKDFDFEDNTQEETIGSFFDGFTKALSTLFTSIPIVLGLVLLILAILAYFFLSKKSEFLKQAGNDSNEFIVVNLPEHLADEYFYDDDEVINQKLIAERRFLIKTNRPHITKKLLNLINDLIRLNIDVNNLNNILIPSWYFNKRFEKRKNIFQNPIPLETVFI